MERRNYMMNMEDLAILRIQMPFLSEATLVRAGVKAMLRLSKEELNELCLKAVAYPGRPRKDDSAKNDKKEEKR